MYMILALLNPFFKTDVITLSLLLLFYFEIFLLNDCVYGSFELCFHGQTVESLLVEIGIS